MSSSRFDTDDDQPFIRPQRGPFTADPRAAAPNLALEDLHRLISRGHISPMGNADRRPPVVRSTAADTAQHPSRRGNRLHYSDGRVTDLDGNPAASAEVQRCSLPDSVYQSERIRRVVDAREDSKAGRRT